MPKRLNLQNQRFGRLVAVEDVGDNKRHQRIWRCKCDCGKITEVVCGNLMSGNTKSCGCYQIECIRESRQTHGMRRTVEYDAWEHMRQRCSNPNDKAYRYYGGRGISVCPEWEESFEAFYADMGNRPLGHTLDRIDNNGDYSKDNCRWATRKEQMRNTRRTCFITHNDETKCMKDWAKEIGIKYTTLWWRLNNGWPVERALENASRHYQMGAGQ